MKNKAVFLDSSFLIASQIADHEFHKRTKELRKQFLKEKTKLMVHYLVVDELWYVLTALGRKSQDKPSEEALHKIVKAATTNIFNFTNLHLLKDNLDLNDLNHALSIQHEYKLRPRDAMIVKLMEKAGITAIASFDGDFDRVDEIIRLY